MKSYVLFWALCLLSLFATAETKNNVSYVHIRHNALINTENTQYLLLTFTLNGIVMPLCDTGTFEIPVMEGLDQGQISFPDVYDIPLVMKLKVGEHYIMEPGECCAVSSFRPMNNEENYKMTYGRGIIQFENVTSDSLYFQAGAHTADLIAPQSSRSVYAAESACCGYNFCHYVLAKREYRAINFIDYTDLEKGIAEEERLKQFELTSGFIQFLHGEKFLIHFNPANQSYEVVLDGYCSSLEIEVLLNSLNSDD